MSPKQESTAGGNDKLHLKIDAHVVRQLGEELISDADQALLELVKNCHDADASKCLIRIDTEHREKIGGQTLVGKMSIIDDGHGMTRDVINDSWLTISRSNKRHAKSQGVKTTRHQRNYLGDKGVGRLSSMKLGRILRIETHSKPRAQGLSVQFDWAEFLEGVNLEDIKIREETLGSKTSTGTSLTVFGLNDPEQWVGEENLTRLQYKLSSLLSPFGQLKDFDLSLSVNGKRLKRHVFSKGLKNSSISSFSFIYEDGILRCNGETSLEFYRGSKISEKAEYKKFIAVDQGQALADKIRSAKKLSSYEIDFEPSAKKAFSYSKNISWEDIPKKGREFKDPGPFSAEVHYFFKDDRLIGFKGVGQQEAKKLIEFLRGIWVYREGFRVGSERQYDWLKLSADKSAGKGFYSLRPENVIGYFDFAAHRNPELVEKSDREGFVENAAYEGFWRITREMLSFMNDFLNHSRRISNELKKERQREEDEKPSTFSVEEAATEFEELTSDASQKADTHEKTKVQLEQTITDAKEDISSALNDLLLDDKAREDLKRLQAKVGEIEKSVGAFSEDYRHFLAMLKKHRASAGLIIERLEAFQEEIEEYYDFVSIGLTALSLAHEVMPQIDNIRLHSNSLTSFLKSKRITETKPFQDLLGIEADTETIAKSISMLNPMLRSERDQVEDVNVNEVFDNYLAMRRESFSNKSIRISFKKEDELVVKFNRGKIIQILDNLVRNSEYWLNHFFRHRKFEKEIHIVVNGEGFFVWDNGQGIRPGMEEVLFDMFTSGKPRGEGQGLGLFIASTLLKQVNGAIFLADERNEYDRKFKFWVDLSEAIVNG